MKKTTNPIQKHILIALAALLPASLSAQNTFTIGFDTDGNIEGFVGYNGTTASAITLTTASGLISGTAIGGDPRIIKATANPTSTPIFSKPAAATWQTAVFRVRETADPLPPGTVVNTFDTTGLIVGLNSTNSGTGVVTALSYSAGAIDVDGFFTVTADISNYTANDIRYLRIDPIGGTDAASNKFEVDYISITKSNTPPSLILPTSPADGATGVSPTANLVATFDEPVSLNTTGTITIKNLTTTSDTVISLPGPDADGTLSVSGNQLTIDPTANLGVPGDELAIEISADAIKDADGTFYAGILSTDAPNWSFIIDNIPPAPNYYHPIPGSGKAPLDGALFIVFNENVLKGATGNLVVYKSDNTLVESIPVTSGNVSVSGSRVTITPTVSLAYATSYYVLIDSGAFTDALGNAYAGISDSAAWAFSTIASDSTILFGDSFNRANDTNLNASAAGKYGSLGALNYTSRVIGVGNVQLSAGQLLAQSNETPGQSGGLVYINDHNFTDAAISSGGGFSITVDLNAYSTAGTGRHMSVGVGQSLAELDAQSTANTTSSAGDLVVGYRNTPSGAGVYVFKNGTLDSSQTGSLPAPPTKMRIDYSLSNFNAGSTVNYGVFFNDSVTAYKTGSFTWSGTNENYISLSSNLFQDATAGTRYALFDNLQIRSNGAGNTAPGISDITDQSVPSGGTVGPVNFTVNDTETAVGSLSLSVSANSNPGLVSSIVFGGSGANRTVTVTPVSGQSGTATITARVTDGGALFAEDSFVLTVTDNYLSWAASQLPTATGGLNDDSDNDGVKNLVEYALQTGGERGALSGNTITFTKRGGLYGNDLTYIIETSETLASGSWTDAVTHGPGLLVSNPTISYTFTSSTPVKKFARLKVVQAP